MSSRVFKNYQVNLGMPFQVRVPSNLCKLTSINFPEEDDKKELIRQLEVEGDDELLAKAREESELIIKEAELEAEGIIQEAKQRAEAASLRLKEEARQKGYQDGFNEGVRQHEALLKEVEALKADSEAKYAQILAGIESDAVDVILDIAKKVIGEELSTNRNIVLHLVCQAFEKCTNRDKAVIKVSQEDYDFIMENMERFMSIAGETEEIEVRKDSSLPSGGCVVETPFGSIDAGVHTRLRKIEEAFGQITGMQSKN